VLVAVQDQDAPHPLLGEQLAGGDDQSVEGAKP
jgi:hypothetical protein